MKPLARAEAVARLKEIAARLDKRSLTRADFAEATGLTRDQIERWFGSFNALLGEAGLA